MQQSQSSKVNTKQIGITLICRQKSLSILIFLFFTCISLFIPDEKVTKEETQRITDITLKVLQTHINDSDTCKGCCILLKVCICDNGNTHTHTHTHTHNSSKTVFIAQEDNRATLIKSGSIGMVIEAMRKHTEDTFLCLYGCNTLSLFGLEEGKQRSKQR